MNEYQRMSDDELIRTAEFEAWLLSNRQQSKQDEQESFVEVCILLTELITRMSEAAQSMDRRRMSFITRGAMLTLVQAEVRTKAMLDKRGRLSVVRQKSTKGPRKKL